MKKLSTFFVLASLLWSSTVAQAATVTYSLMVNQSGPGTFSLFASTGLDNFGIAAYGVPLSGGILTIDHLSPRGIDANDFQPVGFTLLRSADNAFNPVRASQDTVTPTSHLVRGMGQSAGNLNSAPNVVGPLVGTEQVIYSAPLLLATGTWTGVMPSYNFASPDLGANVFTASSGIAVTSTQIQALTTIVPEPGTVVMAAFGGLGLLVAASRRRKARG